MLLDKMSDPMKTIQISSTFTRYPGGRYRKHGNGSGQEFREDYLVPAIKAEDKVVIEMDDTAGYPASFLEEAFGGLVRAGFGMELLREKLELNALKEEFKIYPEIAWSYIEDAANSKKPTEN
jgi:hypothetical protein